MYKKFKGKNLLAIVEESGKYWYPLRDISNIVKMDSTKLRNIFNKNIFNSREMVDYTTIGNTNYYEINSVKKFLKEFYNLEEK